MTNHDELFDREVAAALADDARAAIPAGVSVLPAVRARLGRTARTPADTVGRRPWRRPAVLALVAAALVAAVAVAPLARAATAPVAGWLVRSAGIGPRDAGRITPASGVVKASSAGYTVSLVGAYGDQVHTVLFLRTVPAALAAVQVSDETGRVLPGGGGIGGGPDGSALEFAPFSPGHHQVTAQIVALRPLAPGQRGVVRGSWVLRFPLNVGTTPEAVAIPASGDLGPGVHVAVAHAAGDGHLVDLEIETTGATIDQLGKEPREGEAGPAHGPGALEIRAYDAAGHPLRPVGQSASAAGKGSDVQLRTVTWKQYLEGTGPGVYRLVVTYEGHTFESRSSIR
jgi:hypothetical protein